jgi:hypothetical protein
MYKKEWVKCCFRIIIQRISSLCVRLYHVLKRIGPIGQTQELKRSWYSHSKVPLCAWRTETPNTCLFSLSPWCHMWGYLLYNMKRLITTRFSDYPLAIVSDSRNIGVPANRCVKSRQDLQLRAFLFYRDFRSVWRRSTSWMAEVRFLEGRLISSPRQCPYRLFDPPNPLSNVHRPLFPQKQSGRGLKLTTRLYLVSKSGMMELYLHSHIRLRGAIAYLIRPSHNFIFL